MCLTEIALSACCCAGACCCECLCLPMKMIGVSAKHFSKIGYVMFNLFWILLAIGTLYAGSWFAGWAKWTGISCPGNNETCFTAFGLVRMSFVLMCFQFLIFLVTLARNHCAAVVHDGWWALKFLFVGVFFACTMWINDSFFQGYMEFSRIFSVFFLSYQAILMLIVAYVVNQVLVDNVKDNRACSTGGIILLSLFGIFTVGNIVWIVYQFILFSGCGGNITIMIFTTILAAVIYLIPLLRLR